MSVVFQPAGLGNANELGSNEEKTLQVVGTETLVVETFCKLYNCTLVISLGLFIFLFQYNYFKSLSICDWFLPSMRINSDEAGEWGTIADNMTGDGVLGAIVERRAEIGISALYSWYFSLRIFHSS